MRNDEEYREYFFKNSSKYQKLYLWLYPLFQEGYFSPENNPAPLVDIDNKDSITLHIWQVLDFLETVSIQNKEEPRQDTTDLLLMIVNNVINFRDQEGMRIDNYRTDWYMVKIIFNLPVKEISVDHVKFIGTSLRESRLGRILNSEIEKRVLPVLLKNNLKEHLLELIKILFSFQLESDGLSNNKRTSLIEEYWLYELLERHSKAMSKLVGVDGLNILLSIIEKVISVNESSFNIVWIKTIENHPQNQFPKRFDNQLVSFTRDLLESLNIVDIEQNVIEFLEKEHPIYKRLAFHLINLNYDSLKRIFWNWFDKEIHTLNSTFKHEFYKLLMDNSKHFEKEHFEKLIIWIEGLDYSKYHKKANANQLKKITAYKRKEWLLTIREHSLEAKELYEKYHKINPANIDHPGFDIWSSGARWIGKESPIEDKDEFSKQPINEIVKYILEFNPEDIEITDPLQDCESITEGLANDLESLFIEEPLKFSKAINKFKNVDYIFKCHIISGLEKAWKENKEFDWNEVFDFLIEELSPSFFKLETNHSRWFKDAIANLITVGTTSDDNAFNKKLLPKSKQILFQIIQNRDVNKKVESNDLASYVLNSVDGNSLRALINYALRYGRINSGQSVKWEDDVKDFFTTELKQNTEYSKLFFYFTGWHLSHLQFLDNDWVIENFNSIFPMSNDSLWESSISGYFRFTNTAYLDIYNLLNESNHITKALKFNFSFDEVKNKLIDQICIMFIHDKDNLTAIELIKSKDLNNIVELINSMYYLFRNKQENTREKVLLLWNEIYQNYKVDDSEPAKMIFSNLSKWFVFIDSIDQELNPLLLKTAKYLSVHTDFYQLLEEMDRLVVNNPKYIGQLYIEILENNSYPIYNKENILSIVDGLFHNNEYDAALKICNKYKRKGIYVLNDLSVKYAK